MEAAQLNLKITSEGMTEAQRGLTGLENAATMVEGAVKKMATAFALFKAGGFINDLTQLAARYDTLGVVMKVVGNNAGYTGAQMEQFAQGLQKQGISMLESRNTLAMMASAHIDLANASKLGRVAQDAAVIGNLNSSEAFQRMIYGIQSGQVEILRTIGLNVNFEASYKKLAATLGKSVQDLTEMEKVQARTNVVMEKGKDIAGAYEESLGTVGKAAKSMERIWENLQLLMGAVFQEGFTVIITGLSSAMESAAKWTRENAAALAEMGKAMGDVVRQGEPLGQLLSDIGGGAKGATDSVNFLTSVFRGVALIIAGTTDTLRAFWGELTGFIGDMIQKVGRVADLVTRIGSLGLWSGKGGISKFGESMSKYGENITAQLNERTATGQLLDKWLNDEQARVAKAMKIQQDTATLASGPSWGSAALMASHSQDPREQARIDAGNNARATAKREAELEAARKAMSEPTTPKTHFPAEESGFLYYSLEPRYVHEIEVAVQDYGKSLQGAEAELKKFKAEHLSTWEIVEKAVSHSSQMATDAMVNWMDNLDGVGRSWKTLGDTVASVLRDMIIQMQRAIIQQQLMDPFLKWGIGEIGKMFTSAPALGPLSLIHISEPTRPY